MPATYEQATAAWARLRTVDPLLDAAELLLALMQAKPQVADLVDEEEYSAAGDVARLALRLELLGDPAAAAEAELGQVTPATGRGAAMGWCHGCQAPWGDPEQAKPVLVDYVADPAGQGQAMAQVCTADLRYYWVPALYLVDLEN